MTNEQIVSEIRNGYSVTDYMQLLYESNLPLIKKFIKPYAAYEPMEDLVQESYFGLWEAVQHYETSANVRFMTYAEYWIRQSVQRYLEKCGSVVLQPLIDTFIHKTLIHPQYLDFFMSSLMHFFVVLYCVSRETMV